MHTVIEFVALCIKCKYDINILVQDNPAHVHKYCMYTIECSGIWDHGLRSGLYRYLVSQESGVAGFTVHTILRWRSCLINDVSNRLQCTALRGLQCPVTL